jgi:nanoRNase/pAp phosphatase (c-di-AMP/oligoRNAs hydrolase)
VIDVRLIAGVTGSDSDEEPPYTCDAVVVVDTSGPHRFATAASAASMNVCSSAS